MANLTKGKKKGLFARLSDFFKRTKDEVVESVHHVAEKVHIVKPKEDHKPGAGAQDDPAKTTGLDHATQQTENGFDAGVFKGSRRGKSNSKLSFAGDFNFVPGDVNPDDNIGWK